MRGLKEAAVYALTPASLGYCGRKTPKTPEILRSFIVGTGDENQVRGVLEKFEAAGAYLQLIAKANNIPDSLDPRVVKAYWIGSPLLENVPTSAIKLMFEENFSSFNRSKAKELGRNLPEGVVPHHSLHILWVGSITGVITLDLANQNLCLIKPGKVTAISGNKIEVNSWYLGTKGEQYQIHKDWQTTVRWDQALLTEELKVGDQISIHWATACQILKKREVRALEKYTRQNIEAINAQRR